jgi:cytidylate kinase
MYRIITVEREYGAGGAEIAHALARRLGWKVWDQELTEEIAKLAHVDTSVVRRCEERVDSTLQRLARVFWRGSFERSTDLAGMETFDTDRMVALVRQVLTNVARKGNCVFVGRGAPYLLRERPDAFHVFLYASRSEKLRRVLETGIDEREANDLLDSIDRDRIEFIKHYFNADWPTRCLYHMMINTAIGNENVIATILNTMQILQGTAAPIACEVPQ